MRNQSRAYLLTAFVIFFWSTSATAFKIALKQVRPEMLLFFSTFISAIILLIILFFRKRVAQLKSVSWFDLKVILNGFLNPFLYYLILFKAYDLLPGQIAMTLNYVWPVMLTLLSIPILKQTVHVKSLVAILISFSGAVIIATQGKITGFRSLDPLGIILALSSTIVWATFWLLNARHEQEPLIRLFSGFVWGSIFALIYILISGKWSTPPFFAYIPLCYIALFEMGITFVLWLTALKLSESAAKIGNLIYITPFLSLLILHLVIDEAIFPATMIGLIFIIGGISLQQTGRARA